MFRLGPVPSGLQRLRPWGQSLIGECLLRHRCDQTQLPGPCSGDSWVERAGVCVCGGRGSSWACAQAEGGQVSSRGQWAGAGAGEGGPEWPLPLPSWPDWQGCGGRAGGEVGQSGGASTPSMSQQQASPVLQGAPLGRGRGARLCPPTLALLPGVLGGRGAAPWVLAGPELRVGLGSLGPSRGRS